MKCPCDTCPYEWVDLRNNCSCKDECEDYQGYLLLARLVGQTKKSAEESKQWEKN